LKHHPLFVSAEAELSEVRKVVHQHRLARFELGNFCQLREPEAALTFQNLSIPPAERFYLDEFDWGTQRER